jgi:hypothetical protein
MQYVYLLIEREFLQSAVPVYKIGRTSQENNKRFLQYPKGSRLIFQISVTDSYFLEQEIISLFKHKYILRTDIGHEYFEGDATNMQIDIFNLVITYNHIVPNTTQLFSEFKKIHKTNMKSILVQINRMNKVIPTKKKNNKYIDLSTVEALPLEPCILDESSDASSVEDDCTDFGSDVETETSHENTENNDENISEYFCEKCNYSTKYKWVFDTHKKSKKHILLHDENNNTFQHVCKFCTKKYKSKYGLTRHYSICITKKQSEKNRTKIFTCDTCRYSTNLKSSYEDHMKSKRHSNNLINTPQQECKFCNSIFVTKSGLYKHTRLCTTKKIHEENTKLEEINILRKEIREEIYAQLCV